MSGKKMDLLSLYHRPQEPVSYMNRENEKPDETQRPQQPSLMKGEKEKPDEPLPIDTLSDKHPVEFLRGSIISTTVHTEMPDISDFLELDRNEHFSLFLTKHQILAGRLIEIFLDCNLEDLKSKATNMRDDINPYLFNFAFSVALLHRSDTQDLHIPTLVSTFPDKFVDSKIISKAREVANLYLEGKRKPIVIPPDYTASHLEDEQRVAYFREDIGINLHHWHWHLVYPNDAPLKVINKNRRGELFYYMHHGIIARYNFERLCNKMKRVTRFMKWREPIEEAYFPKMNNAVASKTWASRVNNQKLQDLNRESQGLEVDLDDMDRWRNRIFEAIHSGFIFNDKSERVPLTETEGIDILGNLIEASDLSLNKNYYGNIHNDGHNFISYINDPDGRYLESPGVMGDNATAMRDPIFYRWHSYIDSIFLEHKAMLPKYEVEQLDYPGILVTNIQVKSENKPDNEFSTFWQQSDVDLSNGLDFVPKGPVFVRFTHLNHQDFTYNISVTNEGPARMGTCRIFLAPKFDEKGKTWLLKDQKDMFIEMDSFTVQLTPGDNTITRKSTDSSVTIPFDRTFPDLKKDGPARRDESDEFNYCGCGWPQHMLVPKGTPEGFSCELFIMISNYADDKVEQNSDDTCCSTSAYSFCGLKDKLYPDRRSMGYPFDRLPRDDVSTLQQFLTPNMRVQEVSILFSNHTVKPEKDED